LALAAIPFGLAIGIALGMLGGGGSVLAVPVLVYVLGQSVHQAPTASMVVVTAGALAGGLGHARESHVSWRQASVFVLAAIPGIVAGTALGNAVSGGTLIAAFAVIMLIAAAATWRNASQRIEGRVRQEPACPPLRQACTVAAGLLIGALTGFFGVGGGFLIVPTLVVFLALSMRLAIGTSLAIITATSAHALGTHLLTGRGLDVPVTAAMTAACVLGAVAGTSLAGRVPQRHLGHGFAMMVAAVAGYLLSRPPFSAARPDPDGALVSGDVDPKTHVHRDRFPATVRRSAPSCFTTSASIRDASARRLCCSRLRSSSNTTRDDGHDRAVHVLRA
jgi:uncharacterized membrane protein YfcA